MGSLRRLWGMGVAGNSGISACPQRGWCESKEVWTAAGDGVDDVELTRHRTTLEGTASWPLYCTSEMG